MKAASKTPVKTDGWFRFHEGVSKLWVEEGRYQLAVSALTPDGGPASVLDFDEQTTFSAEAIPRYVNYERGDYRHGIWPSVTGPVDMREASHFFVGVRKDRHLGECEVALAGASVRGLSVPLSDGEHCAVYADFDNYIVGMPRGAAVEFTLAIAEVHEYDYNAPNGDTTLCMLLAGTREIAGDPAFLCTRTRSASKAVQAVLSRSYPTSKITGAHHTHYTAREVNAAVSSWRELDAEILTGLAKQEGATEASMAGFALWLSSLHDGLAYLMWLNGFWAQSNLAAAYQKLKGSVRSAKLLQNNVELDLLPIFEAEVLVNRGVGGINWVEEREHRVHPNVVDLKYDDVYAAACAILSAGARDNKKPFPTMSWDDYWSLRWQYTPTGSVKSQYSTDLEDMPDARELHNKFVALNTMKNLGVDYWLDREPRIEAWTSQKYEWGKQRAIYGCDLTNFVLTNFAFYECEERLPYNFPVGTRADPTYVNSLLNATLADQEAFCFDFEDFNSQHSLSSMQAVLDAYITVFGNQMSEEQKAAAHWASVAVRNQIVHDNLGGTGTYRARGTLFSGWRLTTFVNSVLNKVYTDLIYEVPYGKQKVLSAHNGDDVIIGVRTAREAQRMLANAKKMNVRAQPTKCALMGAAEFLRVDRAAPHGGQYLARGIATLVHSRIESVAAVSAFDSVGANEQRLAEAVERGLSMDVAVRLREMYVRRVAEIYGSDPEVLFKYVVSHRVVGGYSGRADADVSFRFSSVIEENDDAVLNIRDVVQGQRRWYGIADMARVVHTRLLRKTTAKLDVDTIARRLTVATARALALKRYRAVATPNEHVRRDTVNRALAGSFKDLRKSGTLGMARLAGLSINLLNTSKHRFNVLQSKIAQSTDPMRVLAVLV